MGKIEAVLEISKIILPGRRMYMYAPPPIPFMDELFSEEKQLMKWMGIFQVRIFWVGTFQGGIFQGGL